MIAEHTDGERCFVLHSVQPRAGRHDSFANFIEFVLVVLLLLVDAVLVPIRAVRLLLLVVAVLVPIRAVRLLLLVAAVLVPIRALSFCYYFVSNRTIWVLFVLA